VDALLGSRHVQVEIGGVVDITVDGERLERPVTNFGSGLKAGQRAR